MGRSKKLPFPLTTFVTRYAGKLFMFKQRLLKYFSLDTERNSYYILFYYPLKVKKLDILLTEHLCCLSTFALNEKIPFKQLINPSVDQTLLF